MHLWKYIAEKRTGLPTGSEGTWANGSSCGCKGYHAKNVLLMRHFFNSQERKNVSSSVKNQRRHLIPNAVQSNKSNGDYVSWFMPDLWPPSQSLLTLSSGLFFLSKFHTKAHEWVVNLQPVMAFQNVGLRHLWVDLPWIRRLNERHILPRVKSPSQ